MKEITKGSKTISLKLTLICKYIVDRTLRSNISAADNLKLYLKEIRKKAENSVSKNNDISKYSIKNCSCGKKLYFSCLYGINVQCILEILNPNIDENIIIESFKVNDINFSSYCKNDKQLFEFDIETNLKFSTECSFNNNNDNETGSKIPIHPDYNCDEDDIQYIIQHTENQLEKVIKKNGINLTVIALLLYKEMMDDSQSNLYRKCDEPKFWALFQVKLWFNILKGRQVIRI